MSKSKSSAVSTACPSTSRPSNEAVPPIYGWLDAKIKLNDDAAPSAMCLWSEWMLITWYDLRISTFKTGRIMQADDLGGYLGRTTATQQESYMWQTQNRILFYVSIFRVFQRWTCSVCKKVSNWRCIWWVIWLPVQWAQDSVVFTSTIEVMAHRAIMYSVGMNFECPTC